MPKKKREPERAPFFLSEGCKLLEVGQHYSVVDSRKPIQYVPPISLVWLFRRVRKPGKRYSLCSAAPMRNANSPSLLALSSLLLALYSLACWRPAGIGVGGQYNDAKAEIAKGGPRINVNKAIASLEYVVVRDPSYKDSLTLLGRAYYMSGRYQDSFQILKRALAINPEDEIAWIAMGLTVLRLGSDAKGLETLKGGLTLLAKESKPGYRGFEFWDQDSYVQTAIRRAVFAVMKGVENKQGVIQTGEILLTRIDEEEWWANRKQERDQLRPQN